MKTLLGWSLVMFFYITTGCGGDDSNNGENSVGNGSSQLVQLVTPTDQISCYDNLGEIPCPAFPCNSDGSPDFCGQDAQYPDNARTFTESTAGNDVIVTDSLTGLIWQKSYETKYTWQQAIGYCDQLNYAGSTDWRLPDVNELASLVSYETSQPASKFPGMPMHWFWSSSSNANKPGHVWDVKFFDGEVAIMGTMNDFAVRCVRGEPYFRDSADRFYVTDANQQQIVLDKVTGLGWQKDYATTKTWRQALAYCEGLNYGGYDDWRLPNVNELRSLVNYSKQFSASDFPDMPLNAFFWSSTSYALYQSERGYEWQVSFDYGYAIDDNGATEASVRCVRGGP